jgi:hypothetical protein
MSFSAETASPRRRNSCLDMGSTRSAESMFGKGLPKAALRHATNQPSVVVCTSVKVATSTFIEERRRFAEKDQDAGKGQDRAGEALLYSFMERKHTALVAYDVHVRSSLEVDSMCQSNVVVLCPEIRTQPPSRPSRVERLHKRRAGAMAASSYLELTDIRPLMFMYARCILLPPFLHRAMSGSWSAMCHGGKMIARAPSPIVPFGRRVVFRAPTSLHVISHGDCTPIQRQTAQDCTS